MTERTGVVRSIKEVSYPTIILRTLGGQPTYSTVTVRTLGQLSELIDVYVRELPNRTPIYVRNTMVLEVSTLAMVLRKHLRPENADMLISSEMGSRVLRRVFAEAEYLMTFESTAAATRRLRAFADNTEILLTVPDFIKGVVRSRVEVLHEMLIEASDASSRRKSRGDVVGVELGFASDVELHSVKYASAEYEMMLSAKLHESERMSAEPEDNLELELGSSDAGMVLARYRLLSDMDDSTLSEFDESELRDVDFIIIPEE